jgi:hypothetical protein
MSFLKYGFTGVAIAAAIGAAEAQEQLIFKNAGMAAVSAEADPNYNFQNYYLEETVGHKRISTRGRVYVDNAIGISCEFKEKGVSEPNQEGVFSIVGRKAEPLGCISTVKMPENWDGIATTQMGMTARLQKNNKNPFQVAEYMSSQRGDRSLSVLRIWDMATSKVRLQTYEVSVEPTGERSVFKQDWGWFDIKRNDYFERVMAAAGFRPV